MASKGRSDVKVGIFMVITIGAFIGIILTMGSQSQIFDDTYTLNTRFENIAGLIAGSEVRLSGINIGMVETVRFSTEEGDTSVYIVMQINDKGMRRTMKDSKATIQTLGLLGKKYIEILPGSPASGPVADGDFIKAVEPISMTEALDKAGAIMDDIGKTASYLESLIGSLSGAEGKSTDLAAAVTHLKNIVGEVEDGNGVLHTLIYDKSKSKIIADLVATAGSLRQVMEEVKTGDGTMHEMIYGDKGKELVANLAAASASIEQIVGEVKSGKGFLHSIIYEEDKTDLIVELKRTAENLRIVSEKISRGEGTIGALLVDPTIYEDIKKITGDVERSSILKAYIRYTIRKNEAEETPTDTQDSEWGQRDG
jgi:phospholipid/cholesterol/gamma-HCH transport system substrate-binding protein